MEEKRKKYDKQSSYDSLRKLQDQLAQTWGEVQNVELPYNYKDIDNIVIAGMGGSAYSYYLIKALFAKQLNIPFVLANSYRLPSFVNSKTLVIASSYSGTTEETVALAKGALKRGAKLTFVSSGGELAKIAEKNNLAGYFFDPRHNPSGQPRMGQGYMLFGAIGILRNLNLIGLPDEIVERAIKVLKQALGKIEHSAIAQVPKYKDKYLIYVAAEHLNGNAHIIRNQTNETAKQFAMYALIPELNHHLMEGLNYPEGNKPHFVFLQSDLYSKKIKKRMGLTMDVVKQNGAETSGFLNHDFPEPVSEAMVVLAYGGYLTFYLAMEYGIDPAEIPWVDYFKKKLAE